MSRFHKSTGGLGYLETSRVACWYFQGQLSLPHLKKGRGTSVFTKAQLTRSDSNPSPPPSLTPLQQLGQRVLTAKPGSPDKVPSRVASWLDSTKALLSLQQADLRSWNLSASWVAPLKCHWGSPVPPEKSSLSSQPTWGIYTHSHKQGQPPPTCSQWIFWEW